MSTPSPRKLLKLHLLSPSQLPPHPTLAPAQNGTTTDLLPFVTQLLSEGRQLIDETLPGTFKHVKLVKGPESEGGDVEVLAGGKEVDDAKENQGRGEWWFARRSKHQLSPAGTEEIGKASWDEFVEALYREHSVKEGEYTPDIFDARKLCDWDAELSAVEGWEGVGMCIYEMVHELGFPLSHRCFSTLVVTAKDSENSFIDVQVPIDLSAVPSALYCNGKNRAEGSTAQQKKKVVIGQYVSVERCRIIKSEGEASQGDGTVQWDMATASDARGSLPMAIQKMALPNVIAKDVGFVMDWAAKRRGRNEPKVTSGGAAS